MGVSAAQPGRPQFVNLPQVELTGGAVESFVAGTLQTPPSISNGDILYVNAPVVVSGASQVAVGEQLNQQGFYNLGYNQITFPNVSKVIAALGDFDGDGKTDYAFALSPVNGNIGELCIYFGTGAVANNGGGNSSYDGGNVFPPKGRSGCVTFTAQGSKTPVFSYMALLPAVGTTPQQVLVIEDSANATMYLAVNTGLTGSGGVLTGINVAPVANSALSLPDGVGPIFVGDFNGDGRTDFVIDGQAGLAADVYLSVANGVSVIPVRYDAGHVHSLLMQDMDGDNHADMVVESDNGVIQIFKGAADGTFLTGASIGGTAPGLDGFSGNGGHLAAINPQTLDILVTTPIGLSVLQKQNGTLIYGLKGIYNIGPGRESFALANFFGTVNMDLAVNSAEGVAIFAGNPGGSFQASNAYAALAPALSAVAGTFRNAQNNPRGNVDVVVATGATEAQLMTGNGDGTFNLFNGVANSSGPPADVPGNVWSNLLTADFDGDGNPDLLYSFTGLPNPGPSGSTFPIFAIQFGNGDGTFVSPLAFTISNANGINSDGYYVESAVGDFDGDGAGDLANINEYFFGVDSGINGSRAGLNSAFLYAAPNNTPFNLVAAGFFKSGRTNKQDLVFQQGSTILPGLNIGGNNFSVIAPLAGTPSPSTLSAAAMLVTDVDGDGNGDIVVLYMPVPSVGGPPVAPAGVYIWYGNGDGTFSQSPQVIALSRNYSLAAVADMNADGLPDIVLSDGSLVSVLYGQGGRKFGDEQHFLAGQGINAILLADLNGDGRPDVIAANGGATISNAIALGGATAASLTLTPNPDVNTGGITVLMNNLAASPVTGSVTATPEPSAYGSMFTLTATIMPSAGVALPTGTVQFAIDGVNVGGAIAVTPGTASSIATYTVAAGNIYAVGNHALTAVYSGDAVNSGITLTGTHAITGGPTTTELFLCVGPTAACPAPPGVTNPTPPYIANLSMYYGQIWNGTTDAFSNDGSALTGTIALTDNYNGVTSTLCTLQVASGGQCPNSVGTTLGTGVGTNILTSSYSGDASHLASSSQTVTITVLQDTTTAALVGAPNPSPAGQPVTFTATLTGNFTAPTGTVQFSELFPPTTTALLLGTATLVPGPGLSSTATFTTSTLPVGTDTIEVTYAATTDFATAVATTTETITPSLAGSFTLSVTPNPVNIGVGFGSLLAVTVTPLNGFSQDVALKCSNLPQETTCLFVNPTIAGGSGQTTLIVQTTAPHSCGTTQPYFLGSNGGTGMGRGAAPLALPALAGLIALFVPGKRRRWLKLLVALVAVLGAMQMTGCGNCTDLGTRPATYSIQVTGTAAQGAAGSGATASQAVTVNVTI